MARIAFLTERLRLGFGVDLVVDAHATALAERGHDVTVYCVVADGTYGGRPYRVKHVPIPNGARQVMTDTNARRVARSLGLWRGSHDVFIAHTPPFFSLLPLLSGVKIAVDHGVSPRTGRPLAEQADAKLVERLQHQRYFPAADRIVTISQFLADELPAKLADRTVVIRHGAEHYPRATTADSAAMRARLGLGEQDVMALYVGRLAHEPQPYKGVKALVEQFAAGAMGANTRLVMAGFGTDVEEAALRAKGVIPVSNVPVSDMGALYGAADFFVSASRWEGFDLPAIEAQYARTPVVVLDIGAHREVVADGRTGIIAKDHVALAAGVALLAADPSLRGKMGEAAGTWADGFRWADAGDAYDALIRTLVPAQARSTPVRGRREAISALILNYGSSTEDLDDAVGSLVRSDCAELTEIVLADNAAPHNTAVAAEVVARWNEQAAPGRTVKLAAFEKNWGFAGGINRGIALCSNPWVFLLNSDADVHPDAVARCADALAAKGPEVVSIAPKMLLRGSPGFFDAVGNAINERGEAFNLGIGQPDVGQYDLAEACFGPCFGAGLFRKSAWEADQVGPLDESYFMYYEDVDWNWRANLLGFSSITEPSAEVYHQHSGSAALLPFSFKYGLIERNLLCSVFKNFETRHAIALLRGRVKTHMRGMSRGRSVRTTARLLGGFAVRIPQLWADRRQIQARRVRTDAEVVRFSANEQVFFDPNTRGPFYNLESLIVAYRRRAAVCGDAKAAAIAERAAVLAPLAFRFDPGFLESRMDELLAEEPAAAREVVKRLGDAAVQRAE